MRPTLLVTGLLACISCDAPEPVSLRLVDQFANASVEGSPPAVQPERTEWRFDGEGTTSAPHEHTATLGWRAMNDIAGLAVREGMLVGTTGTLPVLHAVRPDDLDENDLLHAIEIRMRVSEGTEIGVTFNGAEEPDAEWARDRIDQLRSQVRAPLIAELTPGDEFLTYTLREAGSTFRIGSMRNILIEPTDAEGAHFEIESIRIIPVKEHLASVPSGPGWHGLAEVYYETIVSRSPERVVWQLDLPSRPWLDLAYGTIEDGPVTFEVTIGTGGAETSVLKRTVTTPRRWETSRLDLSAYAASPVTLTLALDADSDGLLGYWGSPVIRNSGAMPELSDGSEDRATLLDGGSERPQAVILFLADALRRDHLPMYGYERNTTPVLSRLADEGVVFQDNISQGSWTKVSVSSILTSLYPTTHGITAIPDRLPSSATTLSEAFREAGFATWQSSSVVFSGKLTNLHQGVDVLHERASVDDLGHSSSKTARTFTDRFLEWLGDHHDIPFFAFVHVFDPHSPFEPYPPYDTVWASADATAAHEADWETLRDADLPASFVPTQKELDQVGIDADRFTAHEIDWYDASILAMDVEIGRIMQRLEELGLAGKTLFAFISDHGEEFLEHGNQFHGTSTYGEMMNVPLMLWWPGVLPAGTVVQQTTESLDLMPTLLELSGITPPEGAQGQSLIPLVVDPDAVSDFGAIRRAAFSERVRLPDLEMPEEDDVDSFAIVLDGWKLVQIVDPPDGRSEYELYDHQKDPLNMHDVAGDNLEIVERLARELETWREYALASRPPPDTEAIEGLGADEIARLRSLGYIND
jgi:arylsulfatase A-like enzyme